MRKILVTLLMVLTLGILTACSTGDGDYTECTHPDSYTEINHPGMTKKIAACPKHMNCKVYTYYYWIVCSQCGEHIDDYTEVRHISN